MPELRVIDLGLMGYEQAYALQKDLVARKKLDGSLPDYLLLLEHPEVYTSGRKSKALPGVPTVAIERGGEDTFHNPGQLVAYPILAETRDLHKYLRSLEVVLIQTLCQFGIEGERRAGATGVWIHGEQKKIASLGVAVSGWVTYHGIALNVSNDLSGFARINPCGFEATVMTSMAERLGEECPAVSEVKEAFVQRFYEEFSNHAPVSVALPTGALVG